MLSLSFGGARSVGGGGAWMGGEGHVGCVHRVVLRTKRHLHIDEQHVGMQGMCCMLVCNDKLLQGQEDCRLVLDTLVDMGEYLEHLMGMDSVIVRT